MDMQLIIEEVQPVANCVSRRAHMGRYGSARRLGIGEVRRFAGLDAAPELFLRRHKDAEIERVHGDGDLHPFAAAGVIDSTEVRKWGDPHVVLELGHILFGGRRFGE